MALIHHVWVYSGYALVLTCGSIAIWRGSWAERLATAIVWTAWAINPLIQQGFDPGPVTLAVDSVVALAFIAIAHLSRRLWTLFAAGTMVATVVCHLAARMVIETIGYFAFNTVLGLLGGVYVAIAIGLGVWENEYLRRLKERRPE
ncbi:hypothetical protein [Asticcacaulis sp. YBE204]|uniref:hypothetical protein n=1 Tax=Asticcacaulis sp. YBE204 TaxID=1282363 RepID=UPI0003C3B495|nr:hypothetical protein [Asticcacaulis sp. YBE204]ESQ79251.1 hypothetical protein AEYBE204_09585 [Asticcacaulis sp. YBE204]